MLTPLRSGIIKRIHVNQHNIKANAKGADLPVFTVKTSTGNYKGNECEILGASRLVYRPDKPLSCGAKLWIETHAEITISITHKDITL